MAAPWTQIWSRSDAVALFGDAAVSALEGSGPFRAHLRPVRSGPFAWIQTVDDDPDLFLFDGGWHTLKRSVEAFTLALGLALPARDELEFIVDVVERLSGWRVIAAGDGTHEPPHFEGDAVTFFALRRRSAEQGPPAVGSKNSTFHQKGLWEAPFERDQPRPPRPRTEVFRDLIRVVVDTHGYGVHVSVLE